MPKAFIISRRRKHHLNESSENNISNTDVTLHSETQTKEIDRDVNLSETNQNERLSLNSKCISSNGEVNTPATKDSLWDSKRLFEEAKKPQAIGLLRELCVGEKQWNWTQPTGMQDLDYCDEEKRHSLKVLMAPNDSDQNQINSSELLSGSCLDSAGKSKDPRRAILFHEFEEKKDNFIDLNNNNHECDFDKDCELRGVNSNINGGFESKQNLEKSKMPVIHSPSGPLGPKFENFSLYQPQTDRLCVTSAFGESSFPPEFQMISNSAREMDSTPVNGFYRAQYFTQHDNGIRQHHSPRGLTSRDSSVMSAFRSPVKPVRPDQSLPSSSCSSLFSPTTTASPLRRLSPPIHPRIDNHIPSCYQPEPSVITTSSVLDSTGSNSMSGVATMARDNEAEELFSVNHNKHGISEAARNIAGTDKTHSASKPTGNTGTMASHTQEVTAVITSQDIDDSRQLIKDSVRTDQQGPEPSRSGARESRASPSGPRPADRDHRLPWTSGPEKRSPASGDCHLVTVSSPAAERCTTNFETQCLSSEQVGDTRGPSQHLTSPEERIVDQSSHERDSKHNREYILSTSRFPRFVVNSNLSMMSCSQPSNWSIAESIKMSNNLDNDRQIGQSESPSSSRTKSVRRQEQKSKEERSMDAHSTENCRLPHPTTTTFTSGVNTADRIRFTNLSFPELPAMSRENDHKTSEITRAPRKRHRRSHKKRSFMIASLIETDSDSCSDQDMHHDNMPSKLSRLDGRTESKVVPGGSETISSEAYQVHAESNTRKAHMRRPNYLPLESVQKFPGSSSVVDKKVAKGEDRRTNKGNVLLDEHEQEQKHITTNKESYKRETNSFENSASQSFESPVFPFQSGMQHSAQFHPNSELYGVPGIPVPQYPFPSPYWPSFPVDLLKLQENGSMSLNKNVHRHSTNCDNVKKPFNNDTSSTQENSPSLFQPLPLRLLPTGSSLYPYLSQISNSSHAANMHQRGSDMRTDVARLNDTYFHPYQKLVVNSAFMSASSQLQRRATSPTMPPGLHLPMPGESSTMHPMDRAPRHLTPNRSALASTTPTFSPCGSDGISIASSSEAGVSPSPSTSLPSPPSPRPQVLGMSPRSFMMPLERSVLTPSSLMTPIMPGSKATMGSNSMLLNNRISPCPSRLDLRYEHVQLKMGGGASIVDSSKSFKSFLENTNVKLEFINGGNGIKNPLLSTEFAENKIGLVTGSCSLPCPVCSLTFGTAKLLQRHMKSHREIKRFLCTFCAKGFNDTFDLKRHTRTHTGVRPYKCDMCEKAFTQRCSLESHRRKIHGCAEELAFNERRVKLYVCEDCGHSTDMAEEHYAHIRHAHPARPGVAVGVDTEVRGGGRG